MLILQRVMNADMVTSRRPLMFLLMVLSAISSDCFSSSCAPDQAGYDVEVREKITYFYFVYENKKKLPVRLIETADPQTFQQIRSGRNGVCGDLPTPYAKDKSFVYYKGHIVEGADPSAFHLIDAMYARDNTAIYSGTKRLTTRVVEFRLLPNRFPYATDGEKYFYRDKIIDEPGFRFIRNDYPSYARTNTKIYFYGQVIAGADPESFELYYPSMRITRDKNRVYFDGNPIPNADSETFVVIGNYTFKDKRAVYLEGQEIIGADVQNVRLSEFKTYVLDDQTVFRKGKPLPNRDPETFSELQHPWSKDKNGVYYEDNLFEADLSSFRATALQRAEDKNYRYQGNQRICKFNLSEQTPLPPCQ